MSIFDTLEKELDESFSYTLHDKLIFISGFLADDEENEDLLNFVNYLLYTEKPEFTLTPQLDFSNLNINTVSQFQHDNPPLSGCKTYNEYIQEHFNAKQ